MNLWVKVHKQTCMLFAMPNVPNDFNAAPHIFKTQIAFNCHLLIFEKKKVCFYGSLIWDFYFGCLWQSQKGTYTITNTTRKRIYIYIVTKVHILFNFLNDFKSTNYDKKDDCYTSAPWHTRSSKVIVISSQNWLRNTLWDSEIATPLHEQFSMAC